MSIAEKLATIAENEPKVYEKGKTDFGYKKSVSGSYLYIDDINQNEKAISTVITSKNLFNINGSLTDKGHNWTTGTVILEDGKIKATSDYTSGVGTGQIIDVLPNTSYTLSYFVDSMELIGTQGGIWVYDVKEINKTSILYHDNIGKMPNTSYKYTFTTSTDTRRIWLTFNGVATGGGKYIIYDKVQLEKGNVATDYTPYVDISTATINVCNRNLIPFPYPNPNYDKNGITAVMQEDGGILLNGKATADIYLGLFYGSLFYKSMTGWYTGTEYTVSKWLNGALYVSYDNNTKTTFLFISNGQTVTNMLVYPQIVLGAELGKFEKGIMQTYKPTTDGKLEIDAIYPNMSILPTVANVTINTEYYADSEKIIGELTDTIISLGGTLDV